MLNRGQRVCVVLLSVLGTAAVADPAPPGHGTSNGTMQTSDAERQLAMNRRYHSDLLRESAFFRRLIQTRGNTERELAASRLYLALVEEFARVLTPDTDRRARLLNSVYERQIEITESIIKGHDNIAEQLRVH